MSHAHPIESTWRARQKDRRARRAYMMHTSPDQPPVIRHSDSALMLRREILVTGLFKYVTEIQDFAIGSFKS